MRSRLPSLLLVVVAPVTGCGDDRPAPSRADDLRPELEARMEAEASAGFAGTVLVTVDGSPALARG